MTKTYDLVTLYYKGHSPLKKEDTSFLLCLYTMLFVLFGMVGILLFFTFYNAEPVKRQQIFVKDEPQINQMPSGSTTKPIKVPTYPPLVHYYNYEETAPPLINWDHVVEFFVGSEEDTTSDHHIASSSKATTPTYPWNEALDSSTTVDILHQTPSPSTHQPNKELAEEIGVETNIPEAFQNQRNTNLTFVDSSSPAIPAYQHEDHEKFDSSEGISSNTPPRQNQPNQVFADDLEDLSTAISSKPNAHEAHPSQKSYTKELNFFTESFNTVTKASTTPSEANQASLLEIEDSTASETPRNANQEPNFDTEDSSSATKASATDSLVAVVEDNKFTTRTTKHSKFKPIEEDFDEWPESETEAFTTTPPIKKDLNDDVEWVQDLISADKTEHLRVQKDCKSSRCEVAASKMISSINLSVEPCDNFYNFACSGVAPRKGKVEEAILTLDGSSGDFNFVKKFKLLYQSCLEHENYLDYHDRIMKTKKVLNDIGILNFDRDQGDKDITEIIAVLILLNAMPLFNVDVDVVDSTFKLKITPPDKNLMSKYWSPLAETRRNCLRSAQPVNYESTVDITFLYYDYQECQGNYKDYLKSIKISLEELGYFGTLNSTLMNECVKDVIEFVQNSLLPFLDQTHKLQEKIVHLEYVRMNLHDLEEQFPYINWPTFFKVITSNDITNTTSVQVYDKQYFDVLFKKLSTFKKDKLIKGLSAILTEKFYQEVVLPTPKHSRAKYCSKFTRKTLPDISNYLQQKFEVSEDFEERKEYIVSLFYDMKRDFQDSLNGLRWLDEQSRFSMRNKISNLKLELSEDSLANESYMEEAYLNLNLDYADYSRNYYEATKFRRKTLFSLQDKPVTKEDIFKNFVDNLKEDPVFFYGLNRVYIPDGLVQKTYMDFPKYLIVSKIGFSLAKVIGYALDPIGLKFGVHLSDNVSSIYNKFVQDSRRSLPHHLNYNKLNLVFNLNSRISEVERIVENTAMALVTRTIEEIQTQPLLPWVSYTFSREKIFFIALVQEFCVDMSLMEFIVEAHENAILPPQFLVQNILQNSEVFHDQFSCRPSTKMYQFPYLSSFVSKDSDKIT